MLNLFSLIVVTGSLPAIPAAIRDAPVVAPLAELLQAGNPATVSISPYGKLIGLGGYMTQVQRGGYFEVHEVRTRKRLWQVRDLAGPVVSCGFSPDGLLVAIGCG